MKKNRFLCFSLLLLSLTLGSCSNESDSDNEVSVVEPYTRAEVNLKSIEELPDWLVEILKKVESTNAKAGFQASLMTIYQCKWKGEVYYFVYNGVKSCIYCDSVFYADGHLLEWEYPEQACEFTRESTDWVRIYDWM